MAPVVSAGTDAFALADGLVSTAEAKVGEAAAEGQKQVEQAPATANTAGAAAQSGAAATVASVESTVFDAILMLNDLADILYGYAAEVVGRVWGELVQPFLDQTTGREPPAAAAGGIRSQSSQVAVAEPGITVPLIVIAASTGAGFALAYVVRRAIGLAAVPLLSRIAHSEIYNNDSRRGIQELIRSEPGLCLNEIVTRTGASRNAASYHLFVLEKEQEIVSVKDGKYRRYFVRNGKYVNGAKNVVAVLRNETTLRLAQTVLSRPGAIQRDLCIELGATPSATCWHAKRLLELGVIRKQREANTVRYFPGEALAKYDLSDFGLPRLDASLTGGPLPTAA